MPSLGKKTKKHVKNTVSYLEELWKNRGTAQKTDNKADLYNAFIEFVFSGQGDLNIKRLTYGKVRAAFTSHYKRTSLGFDPAFIPQTSSKTHFYGLLKKEIPKDPTTSGYWDTVGHFLLKRGSKPLSTKDRYPVCIEVLYALEIIIAYCLFRKIENVGELIDIHSAYAKEFEKALEADNLDDLVAFIVSNNKKPHYCDDCERIDSCKVVNKRNVHRCLEKTPPTE